MQRELDREERRQLRRNVRDAVLDTLRELGGEAQRRAIEERVRADQRFTPAELAAPAPEKAREGCVRLIDHLLRWELTNLKRDGLLQNPRWGTCRLANAALEAQPVVLAESTTPERLAELEAMSYREYLKTPEWRRTRAAALLGAGNRCALDASHTGPLEVHHNSYDAPRGAERDIDLTVLCQACHRLHHREHRRLGRRAARAQPAAPPTAESAPARRPAARVPPPGWGDAAAEPQPKPSLLRRLLRAS